MAKPLRGRTWASYPSGISRKIPVGINILSRLFKATGAAMLALKSIPEAPAVA
jgi:hypothetical protein